VRDVCRSGPIARVVRELSRYKTGLLCVQEVRLDKGGTATASDFIFLYGKGNENYVLATGVFVHHRRVPAVKKAEFVSDKMSDIVLRGGWCLIIVLNAHAPTEEKNYDSEDSFYKELEQVFDHFLSTI
jgi:hypothetical protein